MQRSPASNEPDYVLGANDREIARLGLQHAVWRPDAALAWQTAGFRRGQTLIDVGCGPGFATLDLADLVGPSGSVHGIDQSAHFLAHLGAQVGARAVAQVRPIRANLAEFDFGGLLADGAWIRWVLAFVPGPRALLSRLANALHAGARIAIHEYSSYENWKVVPRDPDFERLVDVVMASWRRRGGEPNVGLEVPCWLEELGFRLISTRPISHRVTQADTRWQWPTTFALSGLDRLIELDELSASEGSRIRSRLRELFAGEIAMITPTVLEVVAERT